MAIAFEGVATTLSVTNNVTAPAMFVTVTDSTALPTCVIVLIESADVVEPATIVPLICENKVIENCKSYHSRTFHWYASGDVPVASTEATIILPGYSTCAGPSSDTTTGA